MGKMTSIYLTDEEAAELKKFCSENQCTLYSAVKTAIRELVFAPLPEKKPQSTQTTHAQEPPDSQQNSGNQEKKKEGTKGSILRALTRAARTSDESSPLG
jgi:Holliday junction resolvase